MNPDGLHLMLAFIAALAGVGWTIDYRRRVQAEGQRDTAHRIATEKGRRLMVALDERDAAYRHADDTQLLLNAIVGDTEAQRPIHPSLRRIK